MFHPAHTTVDIVLSARFHNTVRAREVYVLIRKAPTEEHALDMNNALLLSSCLSYINIRS